MRVVIFNIGNKLEVDFVNCLIDRGYYVYGLLKDASLFSLIKNPLQFESVNINPIERNMIDNFIVKINPKFIYFFSNQLLRENSFEIPVYNMLENGLSVLYLLETIKNMNSVELVQVLDIDDKSSLFYPKNPYETALMYSYNMVETYRESYGVNCSNAFFKDFINNFVEI